MSKVRFGSDPWTCEWSTIKETLIDALGVKENDTETIIKMIETFAKLELKAIEEFEEAEGVRISHMQDSSNDDLDISDLEF